MTTPASRGVSRRGFLTLSAAAAATPLLAGPATAAPASTGAVVQTAVPTTGTHVITLGTAAGPAVRSARRGIATALVVDGDLYLVDCGLGVVRQMRESELPVDRLRAVLLTHLHSDHVVELPGVLLFNWGPPVDGFVEPFAVVGPGRAGALPIGASVEVAPPAPGTKDLVRKLLAAYAYDINIRVYDEARPPLDELVDARDIDLPAHTHAGPRRELAPEMEPFEVYRDSKVRVLAALVYHPPVFPSYGFRIETAHGIVALSGDTAEHVNVIRLNVIRLAEGADVLVHESVYLPFYEGGGYSEEFINHLAESHTDPAGTGRVAAAAGAGHLVLSHLAGVATDEQWAAPAREHYNGPITVAREGQVFPVE